METRQAQTYYISGYKPDVQLIHHCSCVTYPHPHLHLEKNKRSLISALVHFLELGESLSAVISKNSFGKRRKLQC